MTRVIFYVPNIIGYIRLICGISIVVFHAFEYYESVVVVYATSVVLDFFDGYFARKLNQCSKFGEFLDVLADNISRTMLWICVLTRLSQVEWIIGIMPIMLEWICFVSSHNVQQNTNWKDLSQKTPPPYIVRKVFENGFKNVLGTLAVSGLFLYPLYLYMSRCELILESALLCFILQCCRVFCGGIECWIVMNHIRTIIELDTIRKKQSVN